MKSLGRCRKGPSSSRYLLQSRGESICSIYDWRGKGAVRRLRRGTGQEQVAAEEKEDQWAVG